MTTSKPCSLATEVILLHGTPLEHEAPPTVCYRVLKREGKKFVHTGKVAVAELTDDEVNELDALVTRIERRIHDTIVNPPSLAGPARLGEDEPRAEVKTEPGGP